MDGCGFSHVGWKAFLRAGVNGDADFAVVTTAPTLLHCDRLH